jgi:hypothetical protein
MTDVRDDKTNEAPHGIVISLGTRKVDPPRFSAFVWSEGPDSNAPPQGVKAA